MVNPRIKIVMLLCILLPLTSCGFYPIYAKQDNLIFDLLSNIKIIPLDSSEEGAEYYNHLKNILPLQRHESAYQLNTQLCYVKDYHLTKKHYSDVFRECIRIKVTYKLIESNEHKIITSGKFIKVLSINSHSLPYSDYVNQQHTRKLLAIMSAEEVRNRIILFFAHQKP